MTHDCRCPVCGDVHLAVVLEEPHEEVPEIEATMRCPICWTYGHTHRRDCRYANNGMLHHVMIKPPPLV